MMNEVGATTYNTKMAVWHEVQCEVKLTGVKLNQELSDAKDYKQLFLTVYGRQESVKSGKAFDAHFLLGHTDRVMAIYYKDGLLATGRLHTHCRYDHNQFSYSKVTFRI